LFALHRHTDWCEWTGKYHNWNTVFSSAIKHAVLKFLCHGLSLELFQKFGSFCIWLLGFGSIQLHVFSVSRNYILKIWSLLACDAVLTDK
jgi:hypothetical protein